MKLFRTESLQLNSEKASFTKEKLNIIISAISKIFGIWNPAEKQGFPEIGAYWYYTAFDIKILIIGFGIKL